MVEVLRDMVVETRYTLCPRFTKLYLKDVNRVEFPKKYCILNFSQFSREDNQTSIKHVVRFIIKNGDIASKDVLYLRQFPMTLIKDIFHLVHKPPIKLDEILNRDGT